MDEPVEFVEGADDVVFEFLFLAGLLLVSEFSGHDAFSVVVEIVGVGDDVVVPDFVGFAVGGDEADSVGVALDELLELGEDDVLLVFQEDLDEGILTLPVAAEKEGDGELEQAVGHCDVVFEIVFDC